MEFFRTTDGHLHAGRIAGVIYAAAVIPGCLHVDRHCWTQIVFTAGWWIAFCPKRAAISFSELLQFPRIVGCVLVLAGLAGQFYFAGRR